MAQSRSHHTRQRSNLEPSDHIHSIVPKIPATKRGKAEQLNRFEEEILLALDHFRDAVWLGVHSPLAQPYVIGRAIEVVQEDHSPQQRGEVLKRLLINASIALPEQLFNSSTSPQRLLKVSFFERNPRLTLRQLASALNVSEKTYYRHRADTIRLLAAHIHRSLQPPFRTEDSTPTTALSLFGRDDILKKILSELQAGQPVALIGPSGVGKTSLAQEVARRYANKDISIQAPIFWHTLRAGLSDHLNSLVFALAFFLREHGAEVSWKQLVADHGNIRPEVLYGLIRFDLAQLGSPMPLLCIDEIGTLSDERQTHVEIIHLLEDLSQNVLTLWIGQRLPLSAEHQHLVAGLTEEESGQMLVSLGLKLTPTILSQLWLATHGNPALLKLFASLHRIRGGIDFEETLRLLGRTPSTEFLFHRIWRRLPEEERAILMQLAAFQEAAPVESLERHKLALHQVMKLDLVRETVLGRVEIVPHIATLTYEQISLDIRPALHLQVAQTHEHRGNYASALRHFVLGGQPAYGLWLCHAHHTAEAERGNGALALQALQLIDPALLIDKRDRVLLGISLSQLYTLTGKPDLAEDEWHRVEPYASGLSRALIKRLLGYAYEAQNRAEAALESFRQAIDLWTDLPQNQISLLYGERSRIYQQNIGDLRQAEREALLARLTAEIFHGSVEEQRGNYGAARQMFDSALKIANQISDAPLQKAFAYFYAGNLAWKQNRIPEAIQQLETAIQLCEQLGDAYRPIYGRRNLSAAHIVAGNYLEAIHQASLGLELAVSLNHGELISSLAVNAGEAHYYLGNYDQAENCAWQSYEQEEPRQMPYTFTLLGMIRRAQNKHDESIKHLKDAIQFAQEVEDQGYGFVTYMSVPGGFSVQLYQPKYGK